MQATLATKESLEPILESIRRLDDKLQDAHHEMEQVKEIMRKQERTIENNQKGLLLEIEGLKSRVTSLEDQLNGLKKMIGLLDNKLKDMSKSAIAGGNPAAGGLLDDLMKELAALRHDHNDLKATNQREHDMFKE